MLHSLPPAQRGVTLVEAMIAMTLALLVLGVAVTLFGGTSRGRADLERSNRLAEGTKFALEVLADEVRHAGFYDAVPPARPAGTAPDPCLTDRAELGIVMGDPPTMPVAVRGWRTDEALPACVANRKTGTAAVTLRRVTVETTPRANAVNAAFMQVSKCSKDLPLKFAYGDTPATFGLRNIDCATVADIRRLVVRTYFIARCNDCGRDTIPTLKRVDLDGNTIVETALVEGVEDLRAEYGFDTNNDGSADVYRDGLSGVAGAADDSWANVVAVRLHVLGRSNDSEGGHVEAARVYDFGAAGRIDGAADAYKRTLLSALVRLPNVAGPREQP